MFGVESISLLSSCALKINFIWRKTLLFLSDTNVDFFLQQNFQSCPIKTFLLSWELWQQFFSTLPSSIQIDLPLGRWLWLSLLPFHSTFYKKQFVTQVLKDWCYLIRLSPGSLFSHSSTSSSGISRALQLLFSSPYVLKLTTQAWSSSWRGRFIFCVTIGIDGWSRFEECLLTNWLWLIISLVALYTGTKLFFNFVCSITWKQTL